MMFRASESGDEVWYGETPVAARTPRGWVLLGYRMTRDVRKACTNAISGLDGHPSAWALAKRANEEINQEDT